MSDIYKVFDSLYASFTVQGAPAVSGAVMDGIKERINAVNEEAYTDLAGILDKLRTLSRKTGTAKETLADELLLIYESFEVYLNRYRI